MTGTSGDHRPATVTAALTQVLTGFELEPDPVCRTCRRGLVPEMAVTVVACRDADGAVWAVAGVFCRSCAPSAIPSPTQGVAEALVTGDLGRTGAVCTLDPTAVIGWAGPDEGQLRGKAAP